MPTTMPELVRVNSAAAGSSSRANQRTLSTSGDTTDRRTRNRSSSYGQLVAMLAPESPAVTMTSHLC
jgi:hypothetical protein